MICTFVRSVGKSRYYMPTCARLEHKAMVLVGGMQLKAFVDPVWNGLMHVQDWGNAKRTIQNCSHSRGLERCPDVPLNAYSTGRSSV